MSTDPNRQNPIHIHIRSTRFREHHVWLCFPHSLHSSVAVPFNLTPYHIHAPAYICIGRAYSKSHSMNSCCVWLLSGCFFEYPHRSHFTACMHTNTHTHASVWKLRGYVSNSCICSTLGNTQICIVQFTECSTTEWRAYAYLFVCVCARS